MSSSAEPGGCRYWVLARVVVCILLLGLEWIPILFVFAPGPGGQFLFRFGFICASLFLALGYSSFRFISSELEHTPIGWRFFAGHACALIGFIFLSLIPLRSPTGAGAILLTAGRYLTGSLAVGLAGFALFPPKLAWRMVSRAGPARFYTLPVAMLAWWLTSVPAEVGYKSWRAATDLTFYLVTLLLRLFLPQVVADRTTMTLGGPDFAVTIGPGCTGWEGTALMLVFSVTWLCVRWRDFRFPAALVVIPAAMGAMWLANALRITALILIGVAGAPQVAVTGFHSEAGWIAFNCVALSFAVGARKWSWLAARTPERASQDPFSRSATVAYLLPFLAILAAAMISRAASGGFEWLYPLRLIAAASALWLFRSQYTELDWRFGWPSLLLGGLVFAIWLALGRLSGALPNQSLASGLALLPQSFRLVWIVCRVTAAVTTVPIAEELAFRGFLIRYMISGNFESLSPRDHRLYAVLISSVAFGLLHGSHWMAGTVAGLVYAVAFLRRGRMGDAVAAHATTNALLAAWVLWSHDWGLW